MGKISEQTWMIEKNLAEQSLATTGHLPSGNQVGARFWSMVENHYMQDVATTGNDSRFLRNHCHFVDMVVPRECALPIHVPYLRHSPHLPTKPSHNPFMPCPVPPQLIACVPVIPPCHSGPPTYPGNPGTPCNPPVRNPGPGGTVPEPAGLVLAGIGLLICCMGIRVIDRIRKTCGRL